MPLPLLAASAIMSGVGGLAKTGFGIAQYIHGNQLAKHNIRPTYDIPAETLANRGLAASLAEDGLPAAERAYFTDAAGRGLTAGIDASLQGGGGVNDINNLVDTYSQGLRSLNARSAEMHVANVNNFMGRNSDVAAEKKMQWALNKYEPYKDIAKAASAEKNAGINNIFGGADQAAGAGAAYAGADNYSDLLKGGTASAGAPVQVDRQPIAVPDRVGYSPVQNPQPMDIFNRGEQISMDDLNRYYSHQYE